MCVWGLAAHPSALRWHITVNEWYLCSPCMSGGRARRAKQALPNHLTSCLLIFFVSLLPILHFRNLFSRGSDWVIGVVEHYADLNGFPTGVVCLLNRFSLPDSGNTLASLTEMKAVLPKCLAFIACVYLPERVLFLCLTKPCPWCSRFPIEDTVWCGWVTLGPCKLR